MSSILEPDVKGSIFTPGRGPVSQNNERRALVQFFNWGTGKGHCGENPMSRIPAIKGDDEEPEILPLPQVRALLSAAHTYKVGVVLPYVALGLLAGIRPKELARLSWSNIDLDEGTITIGAKIAKKRERRVVEMPCVTEKDKAGNEITLPPNLKDWFLPIL
jgi:integrase